MGKRTRQRQLKKLAERRAHERRRRQRRKQLLAGVVSVALVGSAAATAFALLRGGEETPSAAPSPSPSPSVTGVACGAEKPLAARERKPQFQRPPRMQLQEGSDYQALIDTSCGTIELDLFEEETPVTVNNFAFLAGKHFYDGVTFHRVIEGFMIQGGAPRPDGTGGPGYEFEDEIVEKLRFDEPGLLAMANPGEPDTNGSQWFITVGPAKHLIGLHTIFGRVTRGMDVVRRINQLPVTGEAPTRTVYIERVRVEAR